MTPDAPPKQPVNGTDAVRMGDSDAALPRYPADEDRAGRFGEASALVAIRPGGRPGDESFPVLKAFQDYLEAERVRGRQRTVMLSGVFSVIIIVILVMFGLMWNSLVKSSREREALLLEVALARGGTQRQQAAAAAAEPRPGDSAKMIADAVARAQAGQTAEFARKLDAMNKLVASIRRDNASMKEALEKRQATQAAAPVPAATVPAAVPAAQVQAPVPAALPAPPVLRVPVVPPPPPPRGYSAGSFGVRIQREPDPVPWQIYMPMK